MTHLDLFAGIGGFSLAARWMGWETVAQVEWDEWCQKVLAKNFPDALRFGDIVEFNKMLQKDAINRALTEISNGKICCDSAEQGLQKCEKEGIKESVFHAERTGLSERFRPGSIDIITGGFPCQPFSHAGKRKGTDDSRYLWPAMLETIRRVKPTYVVGENVAGLVSMENGKTLDRILSDLEDEGYTTEQVIIPACAVGAWHRRDRIWIIAHNERKSNKRITDGSIHTTISRKQGEEAGVVNGGSNSTNVSDTKSERLEGRNNTWGEEEGWTSLRGNITGQDTKTITNSRGQRGCSREAGGEYAEDVRQQPGGEEHGYWDAEPSVGRVANGIPNRVDRLKGLGNAIVPQVIYEIFKAIEQYDNL